MERRRIGGSFLIGFCLTLCVLGLAEACLLIEWNIRQTTYGRVEPGVTYTLEEGQLCLRRTDTGEAIQPISEEMREAFAPLVSAPCRITGWLLRQESAWLERAWDWIDGLAAGDGGVGSRREI